MRTAHSPHVLSRVAVNLFAPNGGPFVGPLLVGVSKADLVAPAGAPKFPATQTLAGWPAEPLAFSLMPARTQARPDLQTCQASYDVHVTARVD